MTPTAPRAYRSGDFTLDLEAHRLTGRDREIRLQPKAFDTLRCLLEQQGVTLGAGAGPFPQAHPVRPRLSYAGVACSISRDT